MLSWPVWVLVNYRHKKTVTTKLRSHFLYFVVKPLEAIIGFILFEIFTQICPSCSFQQAQKPYFKPFLQNFALQHSSFYTVCHIQKCSK
ncbi:Hypothetical protein, predicted transmembrane protein [Mycoplasmopsis bovigenitalium 51080]|uniref:Uncharacterized protein n=1 Tax=Mycoplasmopsis bovigenitalium 51080 TaxID=1188235 RepID=N9TSV3_9BACT|nr:Hypothetical protein, predicted transmembrane protein [Mycoplasmopsis bovigenitalium 51080]